MNQLKMKAKAGVTLVELLVVILIVTILSVSLLPLLKPYIEEAKYAAEALPTLANVQTKVNLYHYENDKLPGTASDTIGHSWTNDMTTGVAAYKPIALTYGNASAASKSLWDNNNGKHLQDVLGVDWQDLVGRRMQPSHFCYHVIKGDGAAQYGYALGVFGDGEGLGKGTGYAVMMIVDTINSNKLVATWSKYKPSYDGQLSFSTAIDPAQAKDSPNCYVPAAAVAFRATGGAPGGGAPGGGATGPWQTLLANLSAAGWKFQGSDE